MIDAIRAQGARTPFTDPGYAKSQLDAVKIEAVKILVEAGMNNAWIARALSISATTVARWRKRI